jgi:hypothetical protein
MRIVATATLVAVAMLGAACGGASREERAKEHFGEYRQAEEARSEAESVLGQVFRDISRAAGERDRAGVLAAVGLGEEALATIERTLATEIAAARALEDYEPTREDGRRLAEALRQTRAGARIVGDQLHIAARDPFLDAAENAAAISRLSAHSTRVSVPAALARRRAVRAIALTLGVDPPVDVMYDAPQANPAG